MAWRIRYVPIAAMLGLLIVGCDPTVDSFDENDLHYSVFGYLHARADTQLVRIEPLRDGMLTSAPGALDVTVALTDLATSQTTPLRDSLFRLRGETVHNFYTTREIVPTGAYRLHVTGPGDAMSHAETQVPDTFPTPTVSEPLGTLPTCDLTDTGRATIQIRGIEHLVAVTTMWYIAYDELPNEVHAFGHLADTVHVADGVVEARIPYGEDWCHIVRQRRQGVRMILEKVEVVVAAGSPDWPDYVGLDLETEMLPAVTSNVEGGVGLLGGVVTDTVLIFPHAQGE